MPKLYNMLWSLSSYIEAMKEFKSNTFWVQGNGASFDNGTVILQL